jgi:hypothetical protein
MATTAEIVSTLTVPRTFWYDHSWRTGDEYPVGTIIRETSRTVTVTFTQVEFDNFESDADYYADCARSGEWSRSDDPSMWAIGQSAVRTMAAIRKQTGG